MSSVNAGWWVDDLKEVCVQFQLDLSCLVDRELDDAAARRAIAHLEECTACRSFFDDIRAQVRAHRQLVDPESLVTQFSHLVGLIGHGHEQEIESLELVHRLASIFYQLGKAYALSAVGPDFRIQVFEQSVPVDVAKNQGRGFVDGVLQRGEVELGGVDWRKARHMFNGKLSAIEGPGEKGRRLLQECLAVDPSHEEARFYLAFLDAHEGRRIRAAKALRDLFRTAIHEENRAHAAVHLGKLYFKEREFKKAIACCRWIVKSGLADEDDRFFVARFNLALYYAHMGDVTRSVQAFRELLDGHPARRSAILRMFLEAPQLHAAIEIQHGFGEALVRECPELFAEVSDPSGPRSRGDGKPEEEV